MNRFLQPLFRNIFGKATPVRRARSRPSYRLHLENLEERIVPSLIASQVLPLIGSGRVGAISGVRAPTRSTVTATPAAIPGGSGPNQTVTLRDVVRGGSAGTPNGGTVTFTVQGVGGAPTRTFTAPVVNGVAQTTFTPVVGTGIFPVTATYTGNTGFTGSSTDSCSQNTVLATAGSFAILAGSTVTNTGPSTVFGNVGVSPGTAITGFPPGSVAGGTTHRADAVTGQAKNDLTTAFNALAALPSLTISNVPFDVGGSTFTPGVYRFGSTVGLTGTLTLNAQGNPNAVFVFQIASSLTTAAASRIVVINTGGREDGNIFFQVGTSATLGTTTRFIGNILADQSISLNNGARINCGRALARIGAVTLINNVITIL